MLTLDLTNEPRWLELLPGVRVKLRPLTTALMVAARADPDIAKLPEGAANEEAALAMAKALGRIAIIDWEGVGDAVGEQIPVSPAGTDALLDIWPAFEAFQTEYVSKALLLEQEKNASALSPTGASAGETPIAPRARDSAKTAPQS